MFSGFDVIDGARRQLREGLICRREYREGAAALQSVDEISSAESGGKGFELSCVDRSLNNVLLRRARICLLVLNELRVPDGLGSKSPLIRNIE